MTEDAKRKRIEQFERTCRERGVPVTTQRRLVLEEILGRDDHPTADQIYDTLKGRLHSLSRTTVYRILDNLVQFGIIAKTCHHGSAARFDPEAHPHHHLVCMRCETIIDVEAHHADKVTWPRVKDLDFEIQDYLIHFRGICGRCRDKRGPEARTPRKTPPRLVRKPGRPVSEPTRPRRRTKP